MQKVSVRVEGMTCAGCAAGVSKLLAAVACVQSSEVDWQTGQLLLQVDEAQMDLCAIADALESGGFDMVECQLL